MTGTHRIDSFRGEYWFLSNFYPHAIVYAQELWPSAEHAYQAAKTHSTTDRQRIRMARSAGEAKRIGRTVTLIPQWEEVKLHVMRQIIAAKFSPASSLSVRLVETGDAILIEGNTWGDRYWGKVNGEGKNWLGRILMEKREELRNDHIFREIWADWEGDEE